MKLWQSLFWILKGTWGIVLWFVLFFLFFFFFLPVSISVSVSISVLFRCVFLFLFYFVFNKHQQVIDADILLEHPQKTFDFICDKLSLPFEGL